MSIKKLLNVILIISMSFAFLQGYILPARAFQKDLHDVLGGVFGIMANETVTKSEKQDLILAKLREGEISRTSVQKANRAMLLGRDNFDTSSMLFMQNGKLRTYLVNEDSHSTVRASEATEADLAKYELSLIALFEAGLEPQLNYIYEVAAWTVDGDGGVHPDDYDWNAGAPENGDHWYYEEERLRQLWSKQDCDTGGIGCGGDSAIILAVIDTGLAFETRTNFDGRAFAQNDDMFGASNINLYINSDETANDNDDDDGNGFYDDRNGFNAQKYVECAAVGANCAAAELAEVGHPNDDQGHGTFVTGMATSLVDNASGSVSPAHNISIMPIKANEPNDGTFTTDSLWWAIDYAVDNGADIINMSLAGFGNDGVLATKISETNTAGVVVVVAMGNFNTGIPMFPAAYTSTIAVGAATLTSGTNVPVRASYSNYGNHIDMVAYVGDSDSGRTTSQRTYTCFFDPNGCDAGDDLTSFTTGGAHGTSFAAPQVAAGAAFLLSRNTSLSPNDVQLTLRTSAQPIGSFIETGYGALDFDYAWESVWSNWAQNGATPSEITMTEFNANLYQAVRGDNSKIYTRSTADGSTWTSWVENGATPSRIAMATFNTNLYQAVRGDNSKTYTRYTTDGTNWENWTEDSLLTSYPVVMAVFDSKLFQAITGVDNKIYTRYTSDGTNWTAWVQNGATPSEITMIVFNSNLYQAVRGDNSKIYTRYTADGSTWTSWVENGATPTRITMEVFNNNLYQAVRGDNSKIYTRYTADGSTWSSWVQNGATPSPVSMKVFNNRLYQSVRGDNSKIYTRYTEDGSTWQSWVENGATPSPITLEVFDSRLFQAVRGSNSKIYTRTLSLL